MHAVTVGTECILTPSLLCFSHRYRVQQRQVRHVSAVFRLVQQAVPRIPCSLPSSTHTRLHASSFTPPPTECNSAKCATCELFSDWCTSCPTSAPYYLAHSCYSVCPGGTVADSTTYTCQVCDTGRPYSWQNTCVSQCPIGTVLSGHACAGMSLLHTTPYPFCFRSN